MKLMEEIDKRHQEIGRKPDPTNPKYLLEYIWLFDIQQEKMWEITREKRIELWDQSTGRYTKEVKYQSLCNDSQGR